MTTYGPQSDKQLVLPMADGPDNIIVDFIYWGDKWMWNVYWCEDGPTHTRVTEVDVTNEMGTIVIRDQPYGKYY